ncbi:MAG TPA: biotin/lipoyl-binding protein [Burkholderiales bacterium]|nr:biotin/lipoyl-binding protein [Burkholderiales bacterium]
MFEGITELRAQDRAFAPDLARLRDQAPAPLPRVVIGAVVALFALLLAWSAIGRLDIIAVAPGKLVPQNYLQIVQPFEAGIVRELLVHEGDAVQAGQVLVRMDPSLAQADSRALTQEFELKELELRRIDAELAGRSTLVRQPNDAPEPYAQVEAQLQHNRRAFLDSLAEQQAQRDKARQDLAAAQETKAALEKSLPVLIAQDEGWQKLADEGFAGKLLAMERKRARIEREGELAAQRHQVEALHATIEQAEQRLAQLRSTYQSKLQAERVETLAQYQKLEAERTKQSHRQDLLELKAPQAGFIKDLATHTQGSVIQPGTVLMTLVPASGALLAEVGQ